MIENIVWKKAENTRIDTEDGRSYIDFTSGVILTNVGHHHKHIVRRIRRTLSRGLLHAYSYDFAEKIQLASLLARITGRDGIAVLSVTGSDAIELAIKVALRKRSGNKSIVITFKNGFHGKTIGSGSVSDISRYKLAGVNDDLKWVRCVEYPADPERYRRFIQQMGSLGAEPAAVLLECVQGSTLDELTLSAATYLHRFCADTGALLVVDEIQTGFFRTGTRFSFEKFDLKPDMICIGKGVTSSLPLSSTILCGRLKRYIQEWDVTTHSANPLCVTSALACLEIYADPKFRRLRADSARGFARFIAAINEAIGRRDNCVARHAGGHLGGILFLDAKDGAERAARFRTACVVDGLLVSAPVGPKKTLVKFSPPLTISNEALKVAARIVIRNLSKILSNG